MSLTKTIAGAILVGMALAMTGCFSSPLAEYYPEDSWCRNGIIGLACEPGGSGGGGGGAIDEGGEVVIVPMAGGHYAVREY